MANSRGKCAGGKDYFPRTQMVSVGLSNVCGLECKRKVLDRHNQHVTKKNIRQTKKKPRLSGALRTIIRKRDSGVCRFCRLVGYRMEVHNIEYRSQGRRDTQANLILLCDEHHRLMHSNKKKWQPL